MDRLEIRLTNHSRNEVGRWTAVELLVNGMNLKSLVGDFERAHDYAPVGGYDSRSLEGMQHAADVLAGEPNSWPGGGEGVLLVCESCREEGCWPLFGRVELGTDRVEWSGFRQPHRPDREYKDLHFAFDRAEYDQELIRAFGKR